MKHAYRLRMKHQRTHNKKIIVELLNLLVCILLVAAKRDVKKCTKYFSDVRSRIQTFISSYNQKFTQDQNIKTLYVH